MTDCRRPQVLQALCSLYILDAGIYREAMARLPADFVSPYLVAQRLIRGIPIRIGAWVVARRQLVVDAVAAVLESADAISTTWSQALQKDTQHLRATAPLVGKFPFCVYVQVLSFALQDVLPWAKSLSRAQQIGYCLSRHPVFFADLVVDDEVEESLARAYSYGVQLHMGALRVFLLAAAEHAHLLAALGWFSRAADVAAVERIARNICDASTLPLGGKLSQGHFDPPELP